jgi:hypothetical protein
MDEIAYLQIGEISAFPLRLKIAHPAGRKGRGRLASFPRGYGKHPRVQVFLFQIPMFKTHECLPVPELLKLFYFCVYFFLPVSTSEENKPKIVIVSDVLKKQQK